MDLSTELARAIHDEDNVDHRWMDALNAVSANERPSRIEDQMIKRATTFLRAFRDIRSNHGKVSELRKVDAPIFDAFKCYSMPTDRCRMESLLLCYDLPLNSLAELMSMRHATVEAYMDLFFDIRGFREDRPRLWRLIRNRAPFLKDQSHGSEMMLWPTLAIQYGFRVLEFFISPREVTAEDRKVLDAVIAGESHLNALRAIKDVPINSYTAENVVRTYENVKERDFRKEQADVMGIQRTSPIAEIFGPVLSSLKEHIRVLDPTQPVPEALTLNLSERFLPQSPLAAGLTEAANGH